jgi:hypothetical protein
VGNNIPTYKNDCWNNVKTIEGHHLVEGIIGEKIKINLFII